MNEIDISEESIRHIKTTLLARDLVYEAHAVKTLRSTLTAAEAEIKQLRDIMQAYRDGDLPDLTAVHMAAVERGKDIMRAERDEALGIAAALTKGIADIVKEYPVCAGTAKGIRGDEQGYGSIHAGRLLIADTAASAREWEARLVERCAEIADAAERNEQPSPSATALRAEAARVREGRG